MDRNALLQRELDRLEQLRKVFEQDALNADLKAFDCLLKIHDRTKSLVTLDDFAAVTKSEFAMLDVDSISDADLQEQFALIWGGYQIEQTAN